ncbi:MAG: type II secretion system GspH family protein [Patescibacteria group bacterium]|nr:type II secretion system GspH family protein [Patescibacteria group bacterium]
MKDWKKGFAQRHFNDYKSSAGFTLIETLVVLGILAMLASILITYSGTARQQDTLTIETNKIGQVVNLAKSLAMSTYGNANNGNFCGYGVYFNINGDINSETNVCGLGNSYCIFHYPLPSDSTCDQVSGFNGIISDNVLLNYTYAMDKSVRFNKGSSLQAVLFVPPQPETFLSGASNAPLTSSGIINLISSDGNSSSSITVSAAGQISFK